MDYTTTNNTTMTNEEDVARAAEVEQAIARAVDLVRVFSERDPHDGNSENPWKDPQKMLDELEQARQDIVTASQRVSKSTTPMVVEGDFRSCYMDLVTNAFADVLEDMRNNSEELDVDVLVDCLQSGMDFLTGEEQEFLVMDDEEDILEDGVATPHEQRRSQLGLHVH